MTQFLICKSMLYVKALVCDKYPIDFKFLNHNFLHRILEDLSDSNFMLLERHCINSNRFHCFKYEKQVCPKVLFHRIHIIKFKKRKH